MSDTAALDVPLERVTFPDLPDAACAGTTDPEAFFSFNDWRIDQARNICRRCPEIRACLAWALTHSEHGLWAGTTEEQRHQLRARHTTPLPAGATS